MRRAKYLVNWNSMNISCSSRKQVLPGNCNITLKLTEIHLRSRTLRSTLPSENLPTRWSPLLTFPERLEKHTLASAAARLSA